MTDEPGHALIRRATRDPGEVTVQIPDLHGRSFLTPTPRRRTIGSPRTGASPLARMRDPPGSRGAGRRAWLSGGGDSSHRSLPGVLGRAAGRGPAPVFRD